jgi:hypothetical protein
MPTITPDHVFKCSPNATHQTVAGEAILIDLNTGSYYSLNETGTWLWEHLDGKRTIGELATELAVACAIPDQVELVRDDLIELVAKLAQEKLVLQS